MWKTAIAMKGPSNFALYILTLVILHCNNRGIHEVWHHTQWHGEEREEGKKVITLPRSLAQGRSSWRCRRSQTLLWSSSLSLILVVIVSISSFYLTLACRASGEGGDCLFQLRATRQCAALRMLLSSFLQGLAKFTGERPSRKNIGVRVSAPQRGESVVTAAVRTRGIDNIRHVWSRVPEVKCFCRHFP